MAKESRLVPVAVKIGAAMGRADREAYQIAKAACSPKKSSDNS